MSTAISMDAVGKRYRLTNDGGSLVKRVASLGRGRPTDLWALRDISFSCAQGETLGVIGRNGSGKTTMLRLLAGVSAPTVGRLRVTGTIAPLIGVGVGFNNELTGRENVFANGQILGMSKARIQRELDEIVAFAELEPFLDVPVKFYSSGMFLRLAFAVAIHVDPEVMLVDEVLAVGDLAFQLKCLDRMTVLRDSGATIVVVTHSMATLHRMAARTIVMSKGRIVFDGATDDAIAVYHELMEEEGADRNAAGVAISAGSSPVPYLGGAKVRCDITDPFGTPTRQIDSGDPLQVRVHAEFDTDVRDPVVGVSVQMYGVGSIYMAHLQPGDYRGAHGPGAPLELTVGLDNRLLAGTYNVTAVVLDEGGRQEMGRATSELFAITSRSDAIGVADLDARFRVDGGELRPRQLRIAR